MSATGIAPPGPVATWAPLAVVLCGTFVYVLDFFVVNVALPAIQRSMAAGPGAVEWVVAGFGLTSAAFLICGGRLGDHYGRRRWFSHGLAAFVAASVLCAVAPDAAFLVAARLAQGIGAAIMAANTLSIIGMVYSGRQRVRAISVYGVVMGLAATGGQLLGGLLIDANIAGLGWRVIFWINVPVGLAALIAAPRLVPESRADHAGRLDLRGAGLLTAALVAAAGWPSAGLARMVVGMPGRGAAAAGRLRGAPAPGWPAWRAAAAGPGHLRRTPAASRADRPGAVLVPACGRVPGSGAVPATRSRPGPAGRRRGVRRAGRGLPAHLVPRPGPDGAVRAPGHPGRRPDCRSRRPPAAGGRCEVGHWRPATGAVLFPGDFFELERAEVTIFQPLSQPVSPGAVIPAPGRSARGADNSKRQGRAGRRLAAGIRVQEIPAVEAAVLVHEGPAYGIDRTYGALGRAVAERAIGVAGPIREYYLVGFADTDDESQHRTEVCWPVFQTAGQ